MTNQSTISPATPAPAPAAKAKVSAPAAKAKAPAKAPVVGIQQRYQDRKVQDAITKAREIKAVAGIVDSASRVAYEFLSDQNILSLANKFADVGLEDLNPVIVGSEVYISFKVFTLKVSKDTPDQLVKRAFFARYKIEKQSTGQNERGHDIYTFALGSMAFVEKGMFQHAKNESASTMPVNIDKIISLLNSGKTLTKTMQSLHDLY